MSKLFQASSTDRTHQLNATQELPERFTKSQMPLAKQLKLKKITNFFYNTQYTEKKNKQVTERSKLKDQVNSEKVHDFVQKYQRYLEKKDVDMLQRVLKEDDQIVSIYYQHPSLTRKPRLRTEAKEQLPQLKETRSHSTYNKSTKRIQISTSEADIGASNYRSRTVSSESDSKRSQEADMSAQSDQTDSESGLLGIDRSISSACNQIKKKLMPQLDEDKPIDQTSFYQFVKTASKLQDLQQYFEFEDDTPFCQMANVQLENNLFPRQIALNKDNFNPHKLILDKRHIGDTYMEALCVSFKSTVYQGLKLLNLQENHITPKGLSYLVANFPEQLKELNLQDNRIGHEGCALLKPICNTLYIGIKRLNLENNNIRDRGALLILEGLRESQKIQKLNLSKNQLTDLIAQTLYSFLIATKTLEVLYLHWNYLKQQSGYAIAKALQRNPILKVLDLSYNAIGSQPKSDCIHSWCKLIENTKLELTHLDFSFNNLSLDLNLFQSIAHSLEENHQIFGLHLEGDQYGCVIDSRGFLRAAQSTDIFDAHEARQQDKVRIDGVNYLVQKQNFDWKLESLLITNCCWICQGWQEVIFTWIPEKSGPLKDGPIFLHVDFENFTPIMMDDQLAQIDTTAGRRASKVTATLRTGKPRLLYETNDQYLTFFEVKQQQLKERYGEKQVTKFILKKMCPPDRRILYFFSNPLDEVQISAIDQKRCEVSEQMLMLRGLDQNFSHFEFLDGTKVQVQTMNFVNYVDTKQSYVLDDKNDYVPLVGVFPRDKEKKYALAKNIQMQRKRKENIQNWNFDQSFFRDYIRDNDAILDECFEYDFSCSKINRYVKNDYDKEKLKEYMRAYYHQIKDTYRYYSSTSLLQGFDTYCVPYPVFIKFIQSSGVLDNHLLKGTDVDLDLMSIKNNMDPEIINNPEKGLIRYQFMELFFRLANDKYVRTQICKSFADAFLRLMKDGLESKLSQIERMQDWRETRFWTRSMDLLIKMKLGFLNKLYDYTTEITNKKWYFKLRWVSVRELFVLLQKTELITEFMTDKDVYVIFSLSMMTQIHETTEDRHLRMSFPEFIEGLARIAEKISPTPIGVPYESQTLPQKQSQYLHIKFESLLTYFYQRLPIADKDMFQDFFVTDDIRISMPTAKAIQRFKNSETFDRNQQELEKKNQMMMESLPWMEIRDLNRRLINPIGVIRYIEAFREPYIHPLYLTFFNQEILIKKPRKIAPKSKKKKQLLKERDKERERSPKDREIDKSPTSLRKPSQQLQQLLAIPEKKVKRKPSPNR